MGAPEQRCRRGRGRGAAPRCPFFSERRGGGGVPQPRSCDSLEARAAGVSGVSGTITKRSQESASPPQPPPPPLQLDTRPGERRQLRRGRPSGPRQPRVLRAGAAAPSGPQRASRARAPRPEPSARAPRRLQTLNFSPHPGRPPPAPSPAPLRAAGEPGDARCPEPSFLPSPSLPRLAPPGKPRLRGGLARCPAGGQPPGAGRPAAPASGGASANSDLKGQSPACPVLPPSPLGLRFPRTENQRREEAGRERCPVPPPPPAGALGA